MGTVPSFGIMECVHVDHFGPITPQSKKYSYVLLASDHHSGFTELFPVKSTGAVETATEIYQRYFLRHGFPDRSVAARRDNWSSPGTLRSQPSVMAGTKKPAAHFQRCRPHSFPATITAGS